MQTLYELLPDLTGILLAALSLAVFFIGTEPRHGS